MQILTGGRQSGQNLYNALKLYNYINSLPDDTIVRVLKKDGIFCLCTDKSISIQKVEEKIEELIKEGRHYNANKIEVLQQLLKKEQ